jgi:hypothetical protein
VMYQVWLKPAGKKQSRPSAGFVLYVSQAPLGLDSFLISL